MNRGIFFLLTEREEEVEYEHRDDVGADGEGSIVEGHGASELEGLVATPAENWSWKKRREKV